MKNEFDDILKKKWETARFPVDDKHREEMIRLLDTPNRRRGGFFWWFSGMLFLVTIGGAIAYFTLSSDNDASVISNKLNTSIESSSNASTHSSDQPSSNFSDQNRTSSNQSSASISPADNVQSQSSNDDNVTESKTEKTATKKSTIQTNSIKENSKTSTQSQNARQSTSESKPDMTLVESKNENFTSPVINHEENVIVVDEISASNQIKSESIVENPEILKAEESAIIRNSMITSPLDDLGMNLLAIEPDEPHQVEPSFERSHPFHLFVETGVGYIPSAGEIDSGWSLRGGAGVGYSLFPKTDLVLSGGYLLQKGGFDFERTSTVQQPDFGVRSAFHTLTPDKLHFVYGKFGVVQRIHRHMISLLGGVQWMYGAQGTIVTNESGIFTEGSQTTNYAWLKLDGMQRLLWNGEINYGYQATPRMSMHLGLKYYFTGLRKEDAELADKGYYWKGDFAPFNPSFSINYRLYGK